MARMARPLVIVAGLLAFFTGACMAYWRIGPLPWQDLITGLGIMLCAILMGHYANEYADFDTDSISRRTRFSGGSGVLPSGLVPRSWALHAAVACLGLTTALTALGLLAGLINESAVALVAIGLPLGWFYSMPPLRLERTWVGELDNSLLGCLMFLMGYVPATGQVDPLAIAVSVPLFLAIFINLLGVHYADREADEIMGKRTMAVALGGRTKRVFALLIIAMYACILLLLPWAPAGAVIAGLLTIPIALWAMRGFLSNGGPQYGSMLMGALFIFMGLGFLLSG